MEGFMYSNKNKISFIDWDNAIEFRLADDGSVSVDIAPRDTYGCYAAFDISGEDVDKLVKFLTCKKDPIDETRALFEEDE
jgi:hypothetical protein